MLPDEKTKRSLAVEVSVIIKLSEMPARVSTMTCPSMPGRMLGQGVGSAETLPTS